MALHLLSSNHFESLRDALLAHLALPGRSPFVPDRVIVPSLGMRRRIELDAARTLGVCANVEFPFLAQWLWGEIAKVVPGVDPVSPFAPDRLAWRIYRLLGERGFTAGHAPLARYLAGDDALLRYDLAVRLAQLFDHYITYRRDWLDAWARGRRVHDGGGAAAAFAHESWQADLWRRIAAELGAARQHPAEAFFAAIGDGSARARGAALPGCAHVFCLPSIPPLYADMLRELAAWTDLHVYVLNPCEAYWEDIVAPRRLAELQARGRADFHEVGNRFLAQWGTQTRAHLQVTIGAWDGATFEDSHYVAPSADTLLARVQQAMLELREIGPGSLAAIPAADRSIEVHVAHSFTRELEVLHDQLLAMFAQERNLAPADVLVVTPALQDAAPLIEAVFGNAGEGRRLPFTITGQARTTRNVVARALLDILALVTSRFPASAFYELLQQPVVARRFGLDAAGLAAVRTWLADAGIRWGLDAAHREAHGVPALASHSFADGLHRLFLGYALPAAIDAPLGAWLAAGDAEGSGAVALGGFAQAVHALERAQRELAAPRPAARWMQALAGVIDALLAPVDTELDDLRELQETLRALHADIGSGAQSAPIALEVVRAALAAALDDPARGGVPGGAITFASMTSLRTLPYRVVCAIGLDDGAFPAVDRPLEFDLIAAAPRPGDRQRRAEDRNVFLDLVVAARERLYLSYTGRDIRDNSSRPPSVVIDDLLDVLVPALATDPHSAAARAAARARLVVEHPLQAFSLDYFRAEADPRLFSFNAEYCAALRAQATAPVPLAPVERDADPEDEDDAVREPAVAFFAAPLPAPGPEFQVVSLERLARFFRNPCRYLLKERLGIVLPQGEEELADDEPLIVGWKERGDLAARLLPALLEGRPPDEVARLAAAGGEYPDGNFGEHLLQAELECLRAFARQVQQASAAPLLPAVHASVPLTIDGAAWRVEGGFGDLRATGRVRYRYDDTRPVEYLQGWIEHVFLCASAPAGVTPCTVWQSRNGRYVLAPLAEARAMLATLVGYYAAGLRAPLHFYPRTSWLYATENLGKAAAAWHTTPYYPFGEDRDVAYRIALRGVADPLDDAFQACASAVYEPMLAVLTDPRVQ